MATARICHFRCFVYSHDDIFARLTARGYLPGYQTMITICRHPN